MPCQRVKPSCSIWRLGVRRTRWRMPRAYRADPPYRFIGVEPGGMHPEEWDPERLGLFVPNTMLFIFLTLLWEMSGHPTKVSSPISATSPGRQAEARLDAVADEPPTDRHPKTLGGASTARLGVHAPLQQRVRKSLVTRWLVSGRISQCPTHHRPFATRSACSIRSSSPFTELAIRRTTKLLWNCSASSISWRRESRPSQAAKFVASSRA